MLSTQQETEHKFQVTFSKCQPGSAPELSCQMRRRRSVPSSAQVKSKASTDPREKAAAASCKHSASNMRSQQGGQCCILKDNTLQDQLAGGGLPVSRYARRHLCTNSAAVATGCRQSSPASSCSNMAATACVCHMIGQAPGRAYVAAGLCNCRHGLATSLSIQQGMSFAGQLLTLRHCTPLSP